MLTVFIRLFLHTEGVTAKKTIFKRSSRFFRHIVQDMGCTLTGLISLQVCMPDIIQVICKIHRTNNECLNRVSFVALRARTALRVGAILFSAAIAQPSNPHRLVTTCHNSCFQCLGLCSGTDLVWSHLATILFCNFCSTIWKHVTS